MLNPREKRSRGMDVITPPPRPDNDTPFILTEEGKQRAFKAIDKGIRYGKIFFFSVLGLAITLGGLIVWVAIHFIRKGW
jgi:hypothetical protein